MEVKELKLDISKDGGTKPNLYVELHVLPILVHLCESRMMSDQSSSSSFERSTASQTTSATSDRSSPALFCDELSLSTEFGHDRYLLNWITSVSSFGKLSSRLLSDLLRCICQKINLYSISGLLSFVVLFF